MDAPEVDLLDEVVEQDVELGAEVPEADAADPSEDEKVDGRKGSKEFREALKAWEATPEGAKYAKTARSDHFRMQELSAIEPGGITALRDRYALLESIGGPEALTTLQERAAGADAMDAQLAEGNPEVLKSLGPEFDEGLSKLAPSILDRMMKSSPELYASTMLPHLMSSLGGSPLVGDLNKMVDILQATHLDEAGKLRAVTGLLGNIGSWFAANEKRAGESQAAPVDQGRTQLNEERGKFEQQQQQAHWSNNINPPVAAYEKSKLEEIFKPYDTRLKLDAAAKADLFSTFKSRITEAAKADTAYMKQMAIYQKQKNPDPAIVANFVKAAINRHAKSVVETSVKARYGKFLGGVSKAAVPVVAGARTAVASPGSAATVVSVRPTTDEIDYRRTSEADQWKGIYTLKSGKKVQVRK